MPLDSRNSSFFPNHKQLLDAGCFFPTLIDGSQRRSSSSFPPICPWSPIHKTFWSQAGKICWTRAILVAQCGKISTECPELLILMYLACCPRCLVKWEMIFSFSFLSMLRTDICVGREETLTFLSITEVKRGIINLRVGHWKPGWLNGASRELIWVPLYSPTKTLWWYWVDICFLRQWYAEDPLPVATPTTIPWESNLSSSSIISSLISENRFSVSTRVPSKSSTMLEKLVGSDELNFFWDGYFFY